jgi:hypothetical protein
MFARVAPAPSRAMVAPAPVAETSAPPPKPPRPLHHHHYYAQQHAQQQQALPPQPPPPPPPQAQQRPRSNSNLSPSAKEFVPRRSASPGEAKESPPPKAHPPHPRGSHQNSSASPELSAQLQFVARLQEGGHLSAGGARCLGAALRNRDLLVLTAFDVGERAGDARHLAGLLCRLAERFEAAGNCLRA